jgi:hypothetical protein
VSVLDQFRTAEEQVAKRLRELKPARRRRRAAKNRGAVSGV